MKHLRLLSVSILLTLAVTGCHHRSERPLPPPQAQAPIISTMPPLPELTISPVELGKPEPVVPIASTPAPVQPQKKRVKVHHYHRASKPESVPAAPDTSTTPSASSTAGTASPLGQLSADDANVSPKQAEQTRHLIDAVQKRLKHLSPALQASHKDTVEEISAFLTQAKQALASNDLVGAETLANKSKILLDELNK